jgi:hypothetical protein
MTTPIPKARLATMDELRDTTLAVHLSPVPSERTLRRWFRNARIPKFKANPLSKRGGGLVFYSVSAVEKFLEQRTLGGRR